MDDGVDGVRVTGKGGPTGVWTGTTGDTGDYCYVTASE